MAAVHTPMTPSTTPSPACVVAHTRVVAVIIKMLREIYAYAGRHDATTQEHSHYRRASPVDELPPAP
jgi:hypothetical protein